MQEKCLDGDHRRKNDWAPLLRWCFEWSHVPPIFGALFVAAMPSCGVNSAVSGALQI
ncbi:hypothetical protein PV327_001617 [Microctonus hyperodae]|uniref:Uncharacterized protein n=1 Tax=Microctonus hyperodae TaxID=165561 RepID=A0AA39KN79_MICHY|nr:hypothetical protein PV327_001617 [Microctonus hyperodae]